MVVIYQASNPESEKSEGNFFYNYTNIYVENFCFEKVPGIAFFKLCALCVPPLFTRLIKPPVNIF